VGKIEGVAMPIMAFYVWTFTGHDGSNEGGN
jgi:hypothetical protein